MKNVPTNLSNLKSKVDKLDVDKLVPVPVDLNKLSDVVKNDIVKKDVYNAKVENIEDETPDITNLAIILLRYIFFPIEYWLLLFLDAAI